MSNYKEKTI